MTKAKQFDEDRLPFLLDKSKCKIVDFSYIYIENTIQGAQYNTPIVKGVANQLRRWPNDLFTLFMTACLVISGLVVLVLVTAILCSPITNDDNCCEWKISGDDHPFNVYFVKEAAQVWSRKEFCYIEATARKEPELTIHLITLIRNSSSSNTLETNFKMSLAIQNANIIVTDLPIDEFFSKSKLSNIAQNLTNELLLLAARAYLLWNSPGIAMHPSTYCNLSTIIKSRNKKKDRDYKSNKLATIDPAIDLQATEVYCQAFPGFVLQEISKNITQIHSLKDALDKFCSRIDKCPEVQVVNLKSRCTVDVSMDCPTVYDS